MLYETKNKPENVSFMQLDSILSFAMDFLRFDTHLLIVLEFVEDDILGNVDIDDEVVIQLSRHLCDDELVKTIFHEIVHVEQILSGRYVIGEGNELGTWVGVRHEGDYWSAPWEIEAYELEEKMYGYYTINARTQSDL